MLWTLSSNERLVYMNKNLRSAVIAGNWKMNKTPMRRLLSSTK